MYSRLRQEGLSCITLEMCFGSYPRMVGLNHFPNLQVLHIVSQTVRKIDGLQFLPKLKELWIIECSLQVNEVVFCNATHNDVQSRAQAASLCLCHVQKCCITLIGIHIVLQFLKLLILLLVLLIVVVIAQQLI